MNKTIVQSFSNTVSKFPNKVAVSYQSKEVTFKELNILVERYATHLAGITSVNDIVAVYLPKSDNSIAAGIAISRASCAYLFLDVKSPVKRIEAILANVKPAVIFTSGGYIKALDTVSHSSLVLDLDTVCSGVNEQLLSERALQVIDTDLYCIINTSGSTGVPKSVALNHRSFLDFCNWALSEFDLADFDSIGSLSPVIFDIFSFELCMLVRYGSRILVVPDGFSAFPIKILDLLKNNDVTFIFWVPTIMVNIANLDLLGSINLKSLKLVWFAGEVFATKHFNYWKRMLPNTLFTNMYGPIEITLDCTFYKIERDFSDDEPLPIGFPCNNTSVLIFKDDETLAEIGEVGELCVRGSSLAMGYYNNDQATKLAFVQNPLNLAYPETIYRTGDMVSVNEHGEILYKGRKDTLIKHMGYRIELTEIEHTAIANKIVKNCCVIYSANDKLIYMHYEPMLDFEDNSLAKSLSGLLPKYMVPTKYIKHNSLRMNPNGKIDRNYYKIINND
jgi:amino acid adenylation domain-containing protein